MGPENKQLDRITRWCDSSCHLFHGKENKWFSNTFQCSWSRCGKIHLPIVWKIHLN